jgi:hypothetical protein
VLWFLIEFFGKWAETGRFPREELRIRPGIAAAGAVTLLGLIVAIVIVQAGR